MTESRDVTRDHKDDVRAGSSAADGQGWYLYGVTRLGSARGEDLLRELDAPQIVSHTPVPPTLQIVEWCDVAALVRAVALADFDPETVQARSDDRAWLEGLVSGHNEVIARVHQRWPILPARFGSLYPSIDDIRRALAESYDTLLAQLARVEGRDEWAVHVYVEPTRIARQETDDEVIRQLKGEITNARPGRAYFLRQKLEREQASASERGLATLARQAYDRLDRHAVDGHVSAPGRTAPDVSPEKEILRAAFLVARHNIDNFHAELVALDGEEGMRVEATGPWPPYGFATLPESER